MQKKNILFSMHVKATMMISDPIIFGHTVAAFFKVFTKNTQILLKT